MLMLTANGKVRCLTSLENYPGVNHNLARYRRPLYQQTEGATSAYVAVTTFFDTLPTDT